MIDIDPPLDGPRSQVPGTSPPDAETPARAPIEPRLREKGLLVLVLFVLTFAGYFAIGLTASAVTARTLRTPLDDAIPLVPACMWLYVWVYTAMVYPCFVVRCPFLFRRAVLAYAVVVVVSLLTWLAFPVTSNGLRADLASIDVSTFHGWGLKVNYTLDPPFNCFPSLHMSIATLAALSAGRARPLWGWVALPPALGIAVAILTVKQHWILDGVAGALLGAAAYALVVRPARVEGRPAEELAYDWRGPAVYMVFHCGLYLALYLAYVAGWTPWAS